MTSKSLPKRVRFFIADDIRADSRKPMIIGFLPNDFVGIEASEGQPEPSKETPIILQSLAILTAFIDCEGPFDAEISLYTPSGIAILEHQKVDGGINSDQATQKHDINFIAKFMPFGIPEFGPYKFVIKLDEQDYEYTFNINRPRQ